jgi:excisionase family DNA binding protein
MAARETENPATKELLSPEELADFLGCGRTFAYRLLAEKTIPSFTIGRLRRVRLVDAREFIERRLADTE